jgi:hypothetical protein
MTTGLQAHLALFIVVIAAAGLIWRPLARRKRPGCGGDCGCRTDDFKSGMRSKIRK